MSQPGPDEPSTSTGGPTVQGVSGDSDSPPAKRVKYTIPDVTPEEALDEVQALMDNCLDYEVFRETLDTINMDQFQEMINMPSVDLGHVVSFPYISIILMSALIQSCLGSSLMYQCSYVSLWVHSSVDGGHRQ